MKKNEVKNTQPPKLTIEEINQHEIYKDLSHDKKLELIDLVYDLSIALYNSYSEEDEKQP